MYRARAGEDIRTADLDAIEAMLSGSGVTWEAYATEARRHDWPRIKNPTGFLKNLARNFRARVQPASAPVTAAEAAAKNYQCPVCFSRTPGEGIRQGNDGNLVPCQCASPEYIARQRARGIFAEETQ